MSQKETYHLPDTALEVDFSGDETKDDYLADFRPQLKASLTRYLIKDGVVFEEKEASSRWKTKGGADSRLEFVIDSWIHAGSYEWKKAKDKHSKKVRWTLACDEQVTILMRPA